MAKSLSHRLADLPLVGRPLAPLADVLRARLVHVRNRLSKPDILPIARQWEEVFGRSQSIAAAFPREAFRPGGILLFPIWGPVTAPATKAVELILAHALRMRGHSVAMMTCGRALPACVVDPIGNHRGRLSPGIRDAYSHGAASCVHCTKGHDQLASSSLVPFLSMASHSRPGDLPDAEAEVDRLTPASYRAHHHAGIHVGEHAFAAAIRATSRGTLEDTPLHNEIFRRQLVAAIVCAKVTHRIFDELRPGQIGLTHGIYVDHGTVAEVARFRGIPVTVYVRPYRQSTVMLCRGETYHKALVSESNALWEDHPLADEDRARLIGYIQSRRRGTQDAVTYHPDPIEGRERIMALLGLDKDKPLVVAYTNVMWDAQLYHASSAYPDMLSWLFATVDHFAARPDVQLVIRVHPAEVKAAKKSLQPVADEIHRRYPSLAGNIRVVGPESNISSYDLAEQACANVIYGTKMGLEMALMRRPVIVAGESFVRGKGFTFDASTPGQYESLLARVTDLPAMGDALYDRALRYGHHFYFRRQIDLPLFHEKSGRTFLDLKSLAELGEGANANLDDICRAFSHGGEYLAHPRP
jgi:hypothetical protein